MKGISVPRTVVENLLKELDPEGTAARRAHRLQKSTYRNSGKISMIVFLHKQPRKVVLCQYNGPNGYFSAPSIDTGVNGKTEGFEFVIPITVPSFQPQFEER